ncbi:MAG: YqaE/Pmp3 family membrane protein [Nodularia sp. (in: cyanobacteria)]|nr:YqaE/Pmp3 family membrane protein [Nodularia sp. (in: cyanobacteria)]
MKIVRLLLGIVLPPLGVFLTVGAGPTLLINILLTLLGWLPGSIHAVWVIAKHEEQINADRRSY